MLNLRTHFLIKKHKETKPLNYYQVITFSPYGLLTISSRSYSLYVKVNGSPLVQILS